MQEEQLRSRFTLGYPEALEVRLPPGGEPPFFAALAALLAGRASSWALLAGLFRFCAGGGSDGDEPELDGPRVSAQLAVCSRMVGYRCFGRT